MKLLVVGAGIAGSCVARKARERGHDVTVQADPDRPAAATAALCVVAPSWFTKQARTAAAEAVRWYASIGALSAASATATRYDSDATQERMGYFSINPEAVLVQPDILEPYYGRPDGYDHVIVCTGAWTPGAGKRTWGVTTIIDQPGAPLRAHLDRPRHMMFACSHGDTIRFGSSVADTEAAAWERQHRMETKALSAGLIPDGKRSHVAGMRLHLPQPGTIVTHPEHISLHGFARVGYSLAPSRATQVLDSL